MEPQRPKIIYIYMYKMDKMGRSGGAGVVLKTILMQSRHKETMIKASKALDSISAAACTKKISSSSDH